MKTLPPALQMHLDSGTTTLCWCWRIAQRSGVVLGFTDHDVDLTFDGTVFEAASGFAATEIRESIGLSVDNLEVESALNSSHLSETALAAGDFDGADIEIFRVNWAETDQRVLVRKGTIGEVRRSGTAFAAEVRGLAHSLQHPQGRVFQYACDADLGDARCGVDLDQPSFRAIGAVQATETDRKFYSLDLAAYDDGWFTRGLIAFTSGPNSGRAGEIKRHAVVDGRATIELWQAPGSEISAGDTFTITAGCDKQLATCRGKFSNAVSYRGFPHMPGNDFLASPIRRNSG